MTVARGLLLGPLAAIVLRPCILCLLSLLLGLPADYRSGWRSERDLGRLLGRIAAIAAGKQSDQEYQRGNQDRCYPRDPKDQKASRATPAVRLAGSGPLSRTAGRIVPRSRRCRFSLARSPELFTEVL